jgi:outer membrane protein OmpA-like peptidoglycan-associated protein
MRPTPRKPLDQLDELRQLLIRPEREELRKLCHRLDDKEQRTHEIASVLPEAITVSADHSDELTRALQPAIEGSIRELLEKRPRLLIDALAPIIGLVVRRALIESLRSVFQSLAQSFSWSGLQWRWEAFRTGRSFAEVVRLRRRRYRVEHLSLINRATSLPLLQVGADATAAAHSELVARSLSALQDFARDSFKTASLEGLEELRVGELHVWIARGAHANLAAVIRGHPPRELRTCLEDAIKRIHLLRGSALAKFDGDTTALESLRPELEPCLCAQDQAEDGSQTHYRAWFALAVVAGCVAAALIVAARSEMRWHDFVRRLNSSPGIAVTKAEKNWFGPSRVIGLRDPAVADPAALARAAGLNPADIRFEWKEYLALDEMSVLRRFEQRFGKPAGANLRLTNGVLTIRGVAPYEWFSQVQRDGSQLPGINSIAAHDTILTYDPALALERFRQAYPLPARVKAAVGQGTLFLSGTAPYEWIAPVREGATKLPGIRRISEAKLQIAYDAPLVLQRFRDRFNLPDSVNAAIEKGVLVLSGEAPHGWLTRVRRGAPAVPGIDKIDERNLIDLDQRAYERSRSAIESAAIEFLPNQPEYTSEGRAALSRLADEIRRCLTATSRLGLAIEIEVRGYADAPGPEQENFALSQKRAEAVRDFLIRSGFESSLFKSLGMAASPSATDASRPEHGDRQVALKILPKL